MRNAPRNLSGDLPLRLRFPVPIEGKTNVRQFALLSSVASPLVLSGPALAQDPVAADRPIVLAEAYALASAQAEVAAAQAILQEAQAS